MGDIYHGRYPKKGDWVRVEIVQKHRTKVVEGIFSGKVRTVRSGAVIGVVWTDVGQDTWIPWTSDTNKVRFYIENRDNVFA